MPSEASASPSSAAEQIMPRDSIPRSLVRLIARSPGRRAPTVATGTFIPSATLAAPQMIGKVFPDPVLTRHRRSFSALGWASMVRTRPTRTPLNAGAAGSTVSTSSPAMVNWSARVRVSTSGSTHSRSHDSLNRISCRPVWIDCRESKRLSRNSL